ncbi:MAG: hypothetical protein WDA09_08595 [Bacteriovoracaceae bacterium]
MWPFKSKKKSEVSELITQLTHHIDLKFHEVKAQIKEVELAVEQLEVKLLTKDLKDKQAYGLLHYKMHEAKNKKLDSEIEELKLALNQKIVSSDQ